MALGNRLNLHGSAAAAAAAIVVGAAGGGGVGEKVTRLESLVVGTVGHGEGRMVLAKYTSICFCLSSLSGLEEKEIVDRVRGRGERGGGGVRGERK